MRSAMKWMLALALLSLPAALAAQVPADTPGKTASGTAYTQPKDWTKNVQGAATTFSAPEGNLNVVVVDAGAAADAQAAAAKAWSIYRPAAARKIRVMTPAAPGEGWDERVNIAYETSPSEKAV